MSLGNKIQISQARIMEWYSRNENKCYVSFSGGKDSTVLVDITAQVCSLLGCRLILWFSDTGLEYPEVKEHVKKYPEYLKDKYGIETKLIMDYPRNKKGKRITFRDVILTKGYPIISKEVARDVCVVKNKPDGKTAQKFIRGSDYHKKYGDAWLLEKWKYLIDSPFKISNKCCNIMKKEPSHKFQKNTGMSVIVGTMANESRERKQNWFKYGCNAFDAEYPSSKPISFWTEQDILEYLLKYQIPYASVYGKIQTGVNGKYYTTGCTRTGCMFCGFGCHLEKEPNRFQRLKKTHPQIWQYCMRPWDEGGLGMKDVLEYIGVEAE